MFFNYLICSFLDSPRLPSLLPPTTTCDWVFNQTGSCDFMFISNPPADNSTLSFQNGKSVFIEFFYFFLSRGIFTGSRVKNDNSNPFTSNTGDSQTCTFTRDKVSSVLKVFYELKLLIYTTYDIYIYIYIYITTLFFQVTSSDSGNYILTITSSMYPSYPLIVFLFVNVVDQPPVTMGPGGQGGGSEGSNSIVVILVCVAVLVAILMGLVGFLYYKRLSSKNGNYLNDISYCIFVYQYNKYLCF